ncbi:hypothetical protein AK812_SmicGene29600 [Symbiodinium microadriaticum]|uniref:Uncharacterized protein n=1 Tax=Symbiodinium microadriaticum TaxID=2951 RepID=A0A1Q9D1C6_SYMMI|nr:hypothetical protein AK812_SmicGene29600 [Symbiodinium microadriaticum]
MHYRNQEDAGSLQKRTEQAEEDVTCDYSGCFPLLDARKKLWSSDKMLVHMFAGEREKKELTFLEGVDRRPPPHWLSRRLAARPCSFEPDAPRKSRIYARPALLSPAHGIISLRCTSRASLTDAGRCPLLLRVAPCKGALDLRCSAPGSFCHVLDWTPTADLRNWEGPGEPALGAVLRAGQRPGPLRRGGCAGVDMIGEWKCVKVEHITMSVLAVQVWLKLRTRAGPGMVECPWEIMEEICSILPGAHRHGCESGQRTVCKDRLHRHPNGYESASCTVSKDRLPRGELKAEYPGNGGWELSEGLYQESTKKIRPGRIWTAFLLVSKAAGLCRRGGWQASKTQPADASDEVWPKQ